MKVVSLIPLGRTARDEIENVDASIELHIAAGWFDGELRDTWGDKTADSYLGRPQDIPPQVERDEILAAADVILGGFPVPVDLVARAPRLRWFHQTPAGASNLHRCDLWGSDVIVTTSRGLGNTLAIAEYVVASFLHFARGLHQASIDREGATFDRMSYRPALLAGKTVCVVGAGGIGQEVRAMGLENGMKLVEGGRELRPLGRHGTDDQALIQRRPIKAEARRVAATVNLGVHQGHHIRAHGAGRAQNPSRDTAHVTRRAPAVSVLALRRRIILRGEARLVEIRYPARGRSMHRADFGVPAAIGAGLGRTGV